MVWQRLAAALGAILLGAAVLGADSTSQAPSTTTTLVHTTIVTTIAIPLPTGSTSHSFTATSFSTSTIVTDVPVAINVTTTSAAAANATASAGANATQPVLLDTHVDPAFGVLGAILILTGLPSAFWGHKNRWSSFFIIGFYTLALVTLSLILKFGVLAAINPPSKTLRGLFVLSCFVAGVAGGGIAIFFWKGAKYFIGAWGGFAVALWIQCFHAGGLIRPIGFRWLFFIACGTVGFCASTIPKWHWHLMLIATSFVGATAFILGVDCFASTGLKEFYVFNLGFNALFPKFNGTGIDFQLTQVMQILLGLIAAVFLMGASVQLRILVVLRRKLQEIGEEQRKREAEAELHAAERFETVQKDLENWEKEHGRKASNLSAMPLLGGEPGTPGVMADRNSSQQSLPFGDPRSRQYSMLSATPTAVRDSPDPGKRQSSGALPALDLGLGISDDIPKDFVATDGENGASKTEHSSADLQHKEDLLAEIATIRMSIDALRSVSGSPRHSIMLGEEGRPRQRSFGQSLGEFDGRLESVRLRDRTRTQSLGLDDEVAATFPRHVRTNSTPMAPARGSIVPAMADAATLNRPSSTPLRDNWDSYAQDRTLVVPPSGVTAPLTPSIISPAPRRASLLTIPTAVTDALLRRQKRESQFLETGAVDPKDIELGHVSRSRDMLPVTGSSSNQSSDDVPLNKAHRRVGSLSGLPPQLADPVPRRPSPGPVKILPPQRKAATPDALTTTAPRTHTFEELTARHREKMRNLQSPLSNAEKQQADIDAARERWERSRNIERGVMARREAEAAARVAREEKERGRQRKKGEPEPEVDGPARTASADRLGSSNRRMSTLKVQEWQQRGAHEAEKPSGRRNSHTLDEAAKRDLKASTEVPFPGKPNTERRRSKTTDQLLRNARDPPA